MGMVVVTSAAGRCALWAAVGGQAQAEAQAALPTRVAGTPTSPTAPW